MIPRILRQSQALAARQYASHSTRLFSTNNARLDKLRIGYVPEHFAAPLHFAYEKFGLAEHAHIEAFPSGSSTMVEAFQHKEIDVGIGLTEAWMVGLSKSIGSAGSAKPYHMVGSYTMSPLSWAVCTGGLRSDISYIDELKGLKVGINRFGGGTHIMASYLAQKNGWPKDDAPGSFEFVECGPFGPLREAVNHAMADFFMWEYFSAKRFYDDGTLKKLGNVETPWNAWHIAALGEKADPRIAQHLLPALEKGVHFFRSQKEEALDYITQHMPYSRDDASEWYDGVEYASRGQMGSLDPEMMKKTFEILQTAGVMGEQKVSTVEDLKATDSEVYS